ncbi:DUF1963 domain-containing protein [Pontivivens ytuae]|uniref:DUF1963 domain-containing protein n=1 Tax=Pontivivens ytuae TaxID=2789856 RepID=A0A7S9QFG5_9RHOB|nr:DUF1963 domain-containing protein [Pontivivens ytuae]
MARAARLRHGEGRYRWRRVGRGLPVPSPLCFIAQIDLATLPARPPELPTEGMLSYFYDAVAQPWGAVPRTRSEVSLSGRRPERSSPAVTRRSSPVPSMSRSHRSRRVPPRACRPSSRRRPTRSMDGPARQIPMRTGTRPSSCASTRAGSRPSTVWAAIPC